MVQVENETGTYRQPARFLARGRSACSTGPVPAALARIRQRRHLEPGVRAARRPGVQRLVRRPLRRRDRRGRAGGARPADVLQRLAVRPLHREWRGEHRQRRAELERDRRLEGGGAAYRSRRARHLQSRCRGLCRLSAIITAGRTMRCSCPRPATPPNMRASSGRRSAAARSASRRSAWIRPAIPITRSAPSGSTTQTIEAFAAPYRLFAPIAARLGAARLRRTRPGASPRATTAPTSRT